VSDFQVKVGGDFTELLRGFQQLEQRAKTAGDNVGKGIGDGIQGFSSKSLAALNQELNRLQQRQLKVAVDSSAFEKAGVQIKEVQGLIGAVQRQQLLIQVDDRSIAALQTKLTDLQNRQTKVSVDSKEFAELQREINATEKELQQISQRKVLIDADANSFLAITAKLKNELNNLQERQLKVDVDSQEFIDLGKEIDRVEKELTQLEQKRTAVTVDSSSVQALQTKLTDLQTRQTKVSVDSQEFVDLQRQIDATEKELEQINQKKILIDADGNSFLAVTTKLKNELDTLQQKQIKVDVDSQEFINLGREIDRVEGELEALDRKRTSVTIDASSVQALQTKLQDLQTRQTKVSVDSREFADLQVQIDKVQQDLLEVERKKILINVDGNSITALTTKLKAELTALEQRRLKIDIDSQEFKTLSVEIDRVEKELNDLDQRKLLINADPSSIVALQSRLGSLRQELEKTQIGSKRFQELQAEIRKTEAELNKATGATNGFQGAMQKLGPALAAIGLAGVGVAQAFKGLISGAAQFDQEVRKAAAIEGGQQFDALRKSIEGVASAAAGTPTQVAELATSLSRAGFSAQETEAALGGIVTGAEATQVAFSDMGTIVAGVLRAFGMEAAKTGDVVDVLVNTANSTSTTIGELGEAFKQSAPVAKNLGISLEDLAATLGLLADKQIRGSEAGTGLKTGLNRLQLAAGGSNEELLGLTRGSEILANAMRQLGADVLDTEGNLKPMDEVILSLRENINKFDTTKRAEIVKALFGEDQVGKFLALLGSSEEEIRKVFGTIRSSAGVAEKTRKEMDSFALSFDTLRGNVEIVTNAIGGAFLAVLKPLVDGLNTVVGVTQALPKPMRDLAAALAAAGIAAGATAVAIGALKLALAGVTVQGVVTAITGLVTALKVNLAGAATVAVVAVQKVGAALIALSTANVGAAIGPLVTALKVNLAGAASVAASAVSALTAAITSGGLVAGLKAFAASAGAAAVALGPLLLAIGAVLALVKTWEFVLGGQAAASKEFEASNKAISEALTKLGVDLDEVSDKANKAKGPFAGLGNIFREAREGWTLMRLVDETEKLEQGFDKVFDSAVTFFNELKNSSEITEEQRKKAQDYITELAKVSEEYQKQAERAKVLAVEQARLGNSDLAKFYESQAKSLTSNANALDNLRQGTEKQIGVESNLKNAIEETKDAQEKIKEAIKARADAESELNKIIAEAPIRQVDAQIAAGQQLLNLSKAISDNEQSQFAIKKAQIEFELKKAQERGASEQQLGALKKQIDNVNLQALLARIEATNQQQQLERTMLDLAQQRARTEADLSIYEARKALLQAEIELGKLGADATEEERSKLQAIVELQRATLGISQERANILAQTQPIEQAILTAQQATQRNTELAQLYQMGYKFAAEGTVEAVNALGGAADRVRVLTTNNADQQERFTRIAQEAGIAVQTAADGSLVLGQRQADVANATNAINEQLSGTLTGIQNTAEGSRVLAERQATAAGITGELNDQIGNTIDGFRVAADGSRVLGEQQIGVANATNQLNNQVGITAQGIRNAANASNVLGRQQANAASATNQLTRQVGGTVQGLARAANASNVLGNQQVNVAKATNTVNRQIQESFIGLRRAANGSIVLGNAQDRVANIGDAITDETYAFYAGLGNATRASQALGSQQKNVAGATNDARNLTGLLNTALSASETTAGRTATQTENIGRAIDGAVDPASDVANAFISTGNSAPRVVQGARDFAGWMSAAKAFAERIASLPLAQQMSVVANSTAQAAGAAKTFYEWLERASRLPGARWTGGPVEAGEQYKINELGQESLLTNGRLSLINAAPNSLWRAPTNGTVIPAGITARLQEQGVLPSKPGAAPITSTGNSNAALAVEVGKLRQEVGELARKQWNVNVAMKTGPTGSQVLRQMMR
jgi:TP901 family phage tail tape measure protein